MKKGPKSPAPAKARAVLSIRPMALMVLAGDRHQHHVRTNPPVRARASVKCQENSSRTISRYGNQRYRTPIGLHPPYRTARCAVR